MKKILGMMVLTWIASAQGQDQPAQRVWSGRLSDSMCGASHHMRSSSGELSERECVFECIKAIAKYVLVDDKQQVLPISNQDLAGFPLYAGRPVRITGELKDGAIVATKIEAIPAHLHLGHVMTNWRDTPSNVGFLIAAISSARVAATQAELAAKSSGSLEEIKQHASDVLAALDPMNGYGVKKAAAGALVHLELAVNAEGATANIKTHAATVSASLQNVLQWTDQAIVGAQNIRMAQSTSEAAPIAAELSKLATQINENGLQQIKAEMDLIMKGEGLENAPR